MAKTLTWKKRRSFWTLLTSYLIVLVIPVSVWIVMYGKFESILINHAHETNLVMMQQLQQVSDSRLQEIEMISEKIAYNPRLMALLGSGASTLSSDQYRFVDFIKDLSQTISRNSFISDSYVYIRSGNHIIGPSFKTNPTTFYENIAYYPGMTQQQWQNSFFDQHHFKTYFPLQDVNLYADSSDGPKRDVVYVQTLPMDSLYDHKGAIVIHINEQNFRTMFDQFETLHQQEVYILDENLDVIIGTKDSMGGALLSLRNQLGASSGQIEARMGDGDQLVTFVTSNMNGWKYISIAPTSVIMESVNKIKQVAWTVLALLIMCGVLICYVMAYRNYSPVRELVAMIARSKSANRHTYIDEYDLIKQAMLHSFNSEQHLQEQLHKQGPLLRANFLTRLLHGFVDMKQLDEHSRQFMNIEFPHEYFRVILIQIESGGKFTVTDHEQEWALVRFMVTNIALEQLPSPGYALELDRQRIAILTSAVSSETSPKEDGIKPFVEGLQTVVSERFGTTLTITVSTVHETPSYAYQEALKALDYKIVHGAGNVLYYDQLHFNQSLHYFYPMELEAQLINYVKSGEETQAAGILDQLYDSNVKRNRITPELARCLYFDINATLLKTINVLDVSYTEVFESEEYPIDQLLESETIEQIHAVTKQFFVKVCLYVKKSRGGHNERMYQELLAYIDSRFCDSNLAHGHVAEEFGITPQYLSMFFKKNAGINLSEYITVRRIEYAKQLMRKPDLTLTQIATQVGYANDIGLIRVFKKMEGITPGKYRENLLYENGD
ncbi:AraC family transcriptional regulator [Paenibacillus sp. GCM10027626]|uniref:AraC family transcriptional regulator n=1 Tax=Paenibacillus sp. GCM10027626 TaxID=3273411 RepID=UPI003638C8D4